LSIFNQPLWADQSILTLGSSIKFVAEVVSSNWQNDYSRKVEDYAVLGIPEYRIADHSGSGGTRHIGKPKPLTLSICTLVNGEYEIQQVRGNQTIASLTSPDLRLTAGVVNGEWMLGLTKTFQLGSEVSNLLS
jgi:Uma2 family endonuclease